MEFVGIRNYREKARLLARGTPWKATVAAADLTYDCMRHLDLLDRLSSNRSIPALRESLYWRYLVATGRSAEGADVRTQHFVDLVGRIEQGGLDLTADPIAVTSDGMRLNGSHRASIAHFLGFEQVEVAMFSWDEVYRRWRVRHIRSEADVKRDAQAKLLGRSAYYESSGALAGTIAYVDADVPSWPLAALGRAARPVPVILTPGAELKPVPLRQLSVR